MSGPSTPPARRDDRRARRDERRASADDPRVRRGPRRPRRALVLALAAAQVALLIGGAAASARFVLTAPLDAEDPYVFLALGSDEGPPREGTAFTGRSDGTHLIVVAPDRTQVTVLSFPRDIWVRVPGHRWDRINKALEVGGPERSVQTIEQVTGLTVDDWAVTNFDAFITAIDEIGGLQITVEQRLRDRFSATNLQPGPQRLSGFDALAYTRDRKSRSGGDFARSAAHGRVLAALHAQIVAEAPSPSRLLHLLATFEKTTVSSLTPERLVRVAGLMLQIPPEAVRLEPVPAYITSVGAASVAKMTSAAPRIFADLRQDGKLG